MTTDTLENTATNSRINPNVNATAESDFAAQRQEKITYFLAQAEQYNFTREFSKAMTFYVRAGLLGDLDAIRTICAKLKSGYGLSYNYDEIFRCMLFGAKNGIADAMYEAGVCYSSGFGTDKDEKEAMYWFSEGAKAGSLEAKKSLRSYNYDFTTEHFDHGSPYSQIVRTAVFIREQGYKNEFDEIDDIAHHIVIFDGKQPVATCRIFYDEDKASYMIGRLCVLKEYRKIGLAGDLLRDAESYIRSQNGKSIMIHAQSRLLEYYLGYDFEPTGKFDEDEGVPHAWMKKTIL